MPSPRRIQSSGCRGSARGISGASSSTGSVRTTSFWFTAPAYDSEAAGAGAGASYAATTSTPCQKATWSRISAAASDGVA